MVDNDQDEAAIGVLEGQVGNFFLGALVTVDPVRAGLDKFGDLAQHVILGNIPEVVGVLAVDHNEGGIGFVGAGVGLPLVVETENPGIVAPGPVAEIAQNGFDPLRAPGGVFSEENVCFWELLMELAHLMDFALIGVEGNAVSGRVPLRIGQNSAREFQGLIEIVVENPDFGLDVMGNEFAFDHFQEFELSFPGEFAGRIIFADHQGFVLEGHGIDRDAQCFVSLDC